MPRAAIGGAGIAAFASTYGILRGGDSLMQRHALEDWRLSSDRFSVQHNLDTLEISQPINEFGRLRSLRLREFNAEDFGGASLTPLERLRLDSLALTLVNSLTHRLAGLDQLKNLNSLSLNLDRSQVCSLAGLE
jgi:hypothetical protein